MQTPASATITAKALTESGLSVAASRVYDATTAATVLGTAALATAEAAGAGTTSDGKAYTGDTVSITGTTTGTYNSKDVATATTVTYGGLSLTGAQNGNYTLTMQTPASATITAKALTESGLSVAASRVYDATTTATVLGTAALATAEAVGAGTTSDGKAYTGDTVAVTGTATGTYNSKDVASANAVTFGGLALNNGNYTLTMQTPASATITAKALTESGLSVAASRVYDATTAATVLGTAALATAEAVGAGTTFDGKAYTSDAVAVTGTATGTYNSKDVASANAVTFGGLALDNSNYTLTMQTPASATITAKALTESGLSVAASRVYDATTAATVLGTAVLATAEAPGAGTTSDGKAYTVDTVSLTGTATGTYNSKDVATATTVTFGGLSLTGAQADNYMLTVQTQAATITPVPSLSAENLITNIPTTSTSTQTSIIPFGSSNTNGQNTSTLGTLQPGNLTILNGGVSMLLVASTNPITSSLSSISNVVTPNTQESSIPTGAATSGGSMPALTGSADTLVASGSSSGTALSATSQQGPTTIIDSSIALPTGSVISGNSNSHTISSPSNTQSSPTGSSSTSDNTSSRLVAIQSQTLLQVPQGGGVLVAAGSVFQSDSKLTVTFTATQSDGRPLPSWLHIDTATGTIKGTPPVGASGVVNVIVVARSSDSQTASSRISITMHK
jgi:hypothetical protein